MEEEGSAGAADSEAVAGVLMVASGAVSKRRGAEVPTEHTENTEN